MKIVAVIQARMSSQRLPGKVLRNVYGRPMLSYLIDRLKSCTEIEGIVLATSNDLSDDCLYQFATEIGLPCFRGALDDVASRLLNAADELGAQAFVRVNGDSPLLDGALVDEFATIFKLNQNIDLVTNVAKRTFPKGQSVEIISCDSLRKQISAGMTAHEMEHVTQGYYSRPDAYNIINIEYKEQLGSVQLSVDTQEDFERFERILGTLSEPYWQHGIDAIVSASRRLNEDTL